MLKNKDKKEKKAKKEHEEKSNWIRENPFKFDLAKKGYYYKKLSAHNSRGRL